MQSGQTLIYLREFAVLDGLDGVGVDAMGVLRTVGSLFHMGESTDHIVARDDRACAFTTLVLLCEQLDAWKNEDGQEQGA